MQVILQEKVANLGQVGDVVKVKPGYARNFLLPQGKALRATEENVKTLESRRVELEKHALEVLEAAKARWTKLEIVEVVMEAQAGEEGKLYGSLGPREVAEAVVKLGHDLNKSEVKLPGGPIRATGEHEVDIVLHSDVHGKLKVLVNATE